METFLKRNDPSNPLESLRKYLYSIEVNLNVNISGQILPKPNYLSYYAISKKDISIMFLINISLILFLPTFSRQL